MSVFTGGGFFGAMVAGTCADRLGRRLAITVGALIFILGGALQASAQNFGYLLGGRIVAGLGVSMLVMIIPLYQAKIAHPEIGGRITAFQQLLLGVGACTASEYRKGLYKATLLTISTSLRGLWHHKRLQHRIGVAYSTWNSSHPHRSPCASYSVFPRITSMVDWSRPTRL